MRLHDYSFVNDDKVLTEATKAAYEAIRKDYILKIPDNWDFECVHKKLTYQEIRGKAVLNGVPTDVFEKYYGGPSSIETDSHIIYLTIYNNGNFDRKPLFLGEIKKQGTNDQRIIEGKRRQAVGNAAPDRVAKNFEIAADFCYLCDKKFFPYNVYLHGCDFAIDEITSTTKAKLQPFFGILNKFSPWFDQNALVYLNAHKGGSCYFQREPYTYKQLYESCYRCCEEGIKYYLNRHLTISNN